MRAGSDVMSVSWDLTNHSARWRRICAIAAGVKHPNALQSGTRHQRDCGAFLGGYDDVLFGVAANSSAQTFQTGLSERSNVAG